MQDGLRFSLVLVDGDGQQVSPTEVDSGSVVSQLAASPQEFLDLAELVLGQATALRAAAVVAMSLDEPYGADAVIEELMVARQISKRSAQYLWGSSVGLMDHPAVWQALMAGDVDVGRARVITQVLGLIPLSLEDGSPNPDYEALCGEVIATGLAQAGQQTAGRLRRTLERILQRHDPDTLRRKRRKRRKGLRERGVWVDHRDDGTADFSARLASEDAEALYAAIRSQAMATESDSETGFDERMAAALMELVLPSTGPNRARIQVNVNVTIPVESLADLTDEPGTVSGYGVLPAEVARRLAAGDARWRGVLTTTRSGQALEVGRYHYRPSSALSRFVRIRDGSCRFPGCAVPATECDLDHLIPFPRGLTTEGNLHALCRSHHRMKHDGRWVVDGLPDGGLRWRSPLGSEATTYPAVDEYREAA